MGAEGEVEAADQGVRPGRAGQDRQEGDEGGTRPHPEHLQLVQEDKVQDQAYRSSSQQQGKRLKKDSVVDVFIIFTASISSLLDVIPRNLLYKDCLIEWQNVFGSLAKFVQTFVCSMESEATAA